eukprot:5329215-Amphidinium_carterae.1
MYRCCNCITLRDFCCYSTLVIAVPFLATFGGIVQSACQVMLVTLVGVPVATTDLYRDRSNVKKSGQVVFAFGELS